MEDSRELFDKWRSQSRKGFLDLCVLSILEAEKEGYGLDLMTRLCDSGLEVTEGTLYPLLMRMTREGTLKSSWTTPDTGHPRKYYRLSEAGADLFVAMRAEYGRTLESYKKLVRGGKA